MIYSNYLIICQRNINRKISFKELNEYKERTLNNIDGHINNMEKELKKEDENDFLFITETNDSFFNNLKGNSKNKVENLFDEIINLRKGKKIVGLVIFNIIFTILGFLIGIASLIVEIIEKIKE